jgi:hypothetical protein
MDHILNMGHHPVTARASVNKILGEGVANKWREHIKDACLSVNFPGMHIDSIKEDGYKASTMFGYIKENLGEEGLKTLDRIISEHDNFDSQISAMCEEPEYAWADVAQRAEAEHKTIALELEDRKPTYVALNPANDPEGAATYYGNRWLKVDEGILKHCTATIGDSFNVSESFAKIWSMEHLKDIFILKQLRRHGLPK